MAQLKNKADASGIYDSLTTEHFSELTVELVAIRVDKSANKPVWVQGELEYTITITNLDTRDPLDLDNPGLPITNVTVEDTIDNDIATLVANSVYINGTLAIEGTDYEYDPATGLLKFIALTDLAAGTFHRITFRVEKVQP